MNRRFIIISLMAGAIFLAILWWLNRPIFSPPSVPAISVNGTASVIPPRPEDQSEQQKQPEQGVSKQNLVYPWQNNTYAPMPADRKLGYDPSLPQWQEWRRRNKADSGWEWKMPINFYGKVIDQNNEPVSAADIRYGWNDVVGSHEQHVKTDLNGLIVIEGLHGKILSVDASKPGYHSSKQGPRAFEYAAFFEGIYHEPDANNPVVFRLIQKMEAEPLVRTEQEVRLPQLGSAATVKLDATTSVEIKLLANQIKPDEPWSLQLTASGGGIAASIDEFSVEAPPSGYQTSITADRKSPKSPGWNGLYEGGNFYVKTAEGYGRIEIKMLSGDNKARVTTFVNPTPGSRNLEYDPAQVSK